jgi:Ca2+-binding RTX toxin-like protein
MPTQSTDINGVPNGITYAAAGESWKILKGVSVTGSTFGVASSFINNALNNNGSVSGGAVGVYFDAISSISDFMVRNGKTGTIDGGTAGVAIGRFNGSTLVKNRGEIEGDNHAIWITDYLGSALVVNSGEVQGGLTAVFFQSGKKMEVENHGSLKAGTAGVAMVFDSPTVSGGLIDNYGKIEAGQYGLYVLSTTDSVVKVVNHEGATLKGGVLSIVTGERLILENQGKIAGTVTSSSYDDRAINKGKIKGDAILGPGDDVFKNKGDKAKSGMIDMGPGNDLVVLGKKADKVLFDAALNAATNVDTVKNFQSGKDKFYLDDDIFSTIGPGKLSSSAFHKGKQAKDADDRIIYDKKTGALYYDPDGAGGVAQTKFAQLDKGTKLKAGDFTIGEYSFPI